MCIIINGLKKDLIRAEIEEGIYRNPSGNFIAVLRNRTVVSAVRDLESGPVLAEFDRARPDDEILLHARIPSQGSKTIDNVHGWKSEEGMYFCHNGTMGTLDKWEDHTDSETFFRKLFLPCWRGEGKQFTDNVEYLIRHFTGSYNKFAFITPEGEVKLYGNYVEDHNCKFSNSSYKIYNPVTRMPSVATLDADIDWDYDGYDGYGGYGGGFYDKPSGHRKTNGIWEPTHARVAASMPTGAAKSKPDVPELPESFPSLRELAKELASRNGNIPDFSTVHRGDEIIRALGVDELIRHSVKIYTACCTVSHLIPPNTGATYGLSNTMLGLIPFQDDPEEIAGTFYSVFSDFLDLKTPVNTEDFLSCIDSLLESVVFASCPLKVNFTRTGAQFVSDITVADLGADALLAMTGVLYDPDNRKENLVHAAKAVREVTKSGKIKTTHVERPLTELVLPVSGTGVAGPKEMKAEAYRIRRCLSELLDFADIVGAGPAVKEEK